jgi:protoporphyrinogen oxidase
LISAFNYPRYGPGQMWEQMTEDIRSHGGEVRLNAPVTRLRVSPDGRVTEVVAGGETLTPSHVISSLPLRTTVGIAEPEAPVEVRDAARGLRYREFLTVALVLEDADPFPDNWIYIHQPGVRVLRIQNFRSWSPWMIPNDTDSSIGMEYFCFEGDELWNMDDDDLVAMGARELQQLKLARADKVKFGFVVRVHKAYPIYDVEYGERVATIRAWLETVGNLTQVGRNGLHRYNNSDHSMLTAMRAVDNILLGTKHDIWAVNAESVYHEEDVEVEQPYRDPPETPAMEQPLASER